MATAPPPATEPDVVPSVAARLALYQRAGGIITPLVTASIAFVIGGLVVLGTGKNPLTTYRAIFNGTGLNWLFPWVHGADRALAATNLQQTLLVTTPLILTGLAVAFAFRCGMFNIGGQGQYAVGSIMAIWVGVSLPKAGGLTGVVYVIAAIGAAAVGGAVWAGIAGLLRATVGAHEVITTIMLNWIAYWIGSWLFGLGGPLQSKTQVSNPVSDDTNQTLHVFWGDPILQGLHVGFFVALGALVVYWIVLNRTTLGYEVRTVGVNPEAARYGGINVPVNYFLAMAIAGMFAGVAGAMDVLGWEFRLNVNDIQTSTIGFIGIAVALLGRNTAVGVFFSSLLFGALVSGANTRHLDQSIFRPELAGNLTLIIQGLIVLFVGADLLVLYLWNVRRKLWRRRTLGTGAQAGTP
jgi:simple sugar transport system permease protein